MKHKHIIVIGLALVPLATASASAMNMQPAPRNSDGSSQLVDPDEQTDRLTDQMRRNDQRLFAHGVMTNSGLIDGRDNRNTPMTTAPTLMLGAPH